MMTKSPVWCYASKWLGVSFQLQHMHTQQLMSGLQLSEQLDEGSAAANASII